MDKLTELTIRQAKPKLKQYKLFDGGGMFLLVHPNGSKYWRMKFNFEDKSKLASFGVWPETSLKDARGKIREKLRKEKEKKEFMNWINNLRKKSVIVIKEDVLSGI